MEKNRLEATSTSIIYSLQEPLQEPSHFSIQMWNRLVRPAAIQIMNVPKLDSIEPFWKIPLDDSPMFSLFHGHNMVCRLKIDFLRHERKTQVLVIRDAESLQCGHRVPRHGACIERIGGRTACINLPS